MNKIIQALREGMIQKLIIGNASIEDVDSKTSVYVPVHIKTNKLLLKSIEVTANKNIPFYVEFFEEKDMKNSRYNSGIVTLENYDVLDLPFIDKDETETMHVRIHNNGDSAASFTIEVRGVSLK